MGVLCGAVGVTKISELEIDADKDWQTKGITNLKQIAALMAKGDLVVKDTAILIRIPTGPDDYVLTSTGVGKIPVWTPKGGALKYYFPVFIDLLGPSVNKNTTRDHSQAGSLPVSSVHVDALGDLPASMIKLLTPAITLPVSRAKNTTRDHSHGETPPITRGYELEVPVTSAQADDGGVFTDETAGAQSGMTKYENYIAGEDNNKSVTATAWEAQTFTPATSHYIRFVWLKLYGGLPGTATLSIRATAASKPTGADLAVATLTDVIVGSSPGKWYQFTFPSPVLLNAATMYAMCLRQDGTGELRWRNDATAPGYAGGSRCYSTDSGASWTQDATIDFMFEEWGTVSPADMHLFPAAIAVGDAYYFGFSQKFNVLIIDVNTPGGGTYTAVWEYSQGAGAWAACVGLVDGSNVFKNQWLREVSHTPQADWAVDTVNGVANTYWLRCRCDNAGAGYSQPLGNFARVRRIV